MAREERGLVAIGADSEQDEVKGEEASYNDALIVCTLE
jgi:hypothetical protein